MCMFAWVSGLGGKAEAYGVLFGLAQRAFTVCRLALIHAFFSTMHTIRGQYTIIASYIKVIDNFQVVIKFEQCNYLI